MVTETGNINLFAHLLRRAGFGATRSELEGISTRGYEEAVESLLNPPSRHSMPEDIIRRYHVDQSELRIVDSAAANWIYRMVSTDNPLEEKIALFWHSLFATGERKVNNTKTMFGQIDTFRRHGLGSFRDLLIELSRDPAMLYWLDNNDNHRESINENYGRELLELFSMGIGNYTEDDVKECARAFTGWTIQNAGYMALRSHKASIWPYSRVAWQYEYRPDDHDEGVKTFLGETGDFDGDDVVDIIVRNPATALFVCTRLYQFFVADELTGDGELLIEELAIVYFDSAYDIRSVLRALFNSDHFKSEAATFARVKSPVELVVGTLKTAGAFSWPSIEICEVALSTNYMGQELMNPPNVEGWHEGAEWIDSGSLMERVNFAAKWLGDPSSPGVREIARRIQVSGETTMSPEQLVQACLDLIGPLTVSQDTQDALNEIAYFDGEVNLRDDDALRERVASLLRLIASTREYQLA